MMRMMQGMENKMEGLNKEMSGMNNKMDTNTDKMEKTRGEMRQVGRCLQAGKMATPRAGTSELRGSATAVGPAVAAGEDRTIRETCRTRHEVTEEKKLNGVTDVYGRTGGDRADRDTGDRKNRGKTTRWGRG